MYVENRGRVFYFTLSYGISSRPVVSPFISAFSAQSFSSFSHRAKHVRSLVFSCSRDVLALVVHGVHVYPRFARSVTRNFFCTNRLHETSESAEQKPHLIKNATQSPKMGPVQRRVGRIGVYAASIMSGLMWTRHFHLREQRLRKFIGTKIK